MTHDSISEESAELRKQRVLNHLFLQPLQRLLELSFGLKPLAFIAEMSVEECLRILSTHT